MRDDVGKRCEVKGCTIQATTAGNNRFPHVRQQHSWDCGLACLYMYLQACGQHCDYALLRQRAATESVWTVDLAHLARSFGLGVEFTSLMLGQPNPLYKSEKFYMEHIQEDEQRVIKLFEAAAESGIHLRQCSLSWQTLASVLSKHQNQAGMLATVLVLVDKRRLPHNFKLCQRQPPPSLSLQQQEQTQQQLESHNTHSLHQGEELHHPQHHDYNHQQPQPVRTCVRLRGTEMSTSNSPGRKSPTGGDYIGHYILLVEWDHAATRFAVLDPDSPIAPLFLSPLELDHARKAFGTDEDVCVLSCPPSSLLMEPSLSRGANASSSPTAAGEAAKQQVQPQRIRQVAV